MKRRRGMTLLELTISAAVMAAMLTMALHMLRVLTDRQRAFDRRAIALYGVQAVAGKVANLPWDQLTSEDASQLPIPPEIAARLAGAKLKVAVAEESSPVVSKRISVELTWTDPSGQQVAPARLTCWAFPEKTK